MCIRGLYSSRSSKIGMPSSSLKQLDPYDCRVTAMYLQSAAQPLLWVGLGSGHLIIYDTTTCAPLMMTRRHINAIRSIQSMRVPGNRNTCPRKLFVFVIFTCKMVHVFSVIFNPLRPIADLAVIIDSTYCRRHK